MNANNTQTIRITAATYVQLADHKKKTGLPITTFVEKAIHEKFKRIKAKKKTV